MRSPNIEKKYMPEIAQKEIEELRKAIEATSEKIINENIEKMKKTDPNRPEVMQYFDEIASFATREKEIRAAKNEGKKVIGYTCLFAPIELILASGAIPVRVNSGWYDASKLGDRIVPVEVCPMVRSTIGAKMIALSPYLELSDALISVLTCDGMTKLGEILSDYKPVWAMTLPRVKDTAQSTRLWRDEIGTVKKQIEGLTGNKIKQKQLKSAITLTQKATKAFRRLQDLRKGSPVIMGRDAMLVNQTYMWDDIERWTKKTEALCDELEKRLRQKKVGRSLCREGKGCAKAH